MSACSKGLIIVMGLLLAGAGMAKQPPRTQDAPDKALRSSEYASTPSLRYRHRLDAATAAASRQNPLRARRALAALIADPLFAGLGGAQQRITLSTAGSVALRLHDHAGARDLLLRATIADPGDPHDWYLLSQLDSELGHHDAAATHLTRLAQDWPELLDNLDEAHLFRVIRQAESASQARLDLLQTLFDANWTRKQRGASNAWYDLALMRVERGETAAARAAIERITWPMQLVLLRSDKRFDALVDANAPAFDVERAARQHVDDLRLRALLEPDSLELLTELSYAMLTAGMHEDALGLADGVLAAIASAPAHAPPFLDMDQQVWAMNNRALVLRRMGRIDEALAQLVHASALTEDGQVNVSQALNLGQFYCSLGRPAEALAAIANVGGMSGYGRMVQALVQQRAALRQGDHTGAELALDYIRAHRKDSPAILLEALVEADHMDEASAMLIDQLASPTERAQALSGLQGYLLADPLPGNLTVRARQRALTARADVQEAVNRVGRIQRYAIYGDHGTD